MNLASLRAGLTKNKTPLMALGAVAVAGLAWRARSQAKTPGSSGTTYSTGAGSTSPTPYSYAPTSGGTSYDSTASDVYNAIQPELEQLQRLYSSVPVPGTPTTPAPSPSWTASETDPRRQQIITDYQSQLGREPTRSDVNWWDNSGKNLADIHALIGQSAEAQAAK
ncbi:MAG: hypothetical protein BGO38_07900 [Cellulomonas sp. 73-145]|uniref:hypothetical protein n=1 Tax=Cellulomonas sp. 73-145 TaxID=1895739 RepID=UPI000925BE59|nr:hypothetical protein [Cellulomonas sp. 73-145]MBN9327809.1 hypothetical protein [Cellulomonas sp.]OJV58115.1 MAG: hypothetical protein BGO38_07900 [Cellulomonas sp. 73-145]